MTDPFKSADDANHQFVTSYRGGPVSAIVNQSGLRRRMVGPLVDINGVAVADPEGDAALSAQLAGLGVGPTRGVYNLSTTNLRATLAGLAAVRAGVRNSLWCVIGDSTDRGAQNSPSWAGGQALAWPTKLSGMLTNDFGVTVAVDSTWCDGAAGNTNFDAYDARVARQAWYASPYFSCGGALWKSGGGGTNGFNFTPTGQWDTADIYIPTFPYAQNGTVTIKIDGATPSSGAASVNVNSAASMTRVTVSAASVGVHTVNILQDATVGKETYLAGISCYSSASKRILIQNMGWGGAKTSNWLATLGFPWDPKPAFSSLNADLYIINLKINDLIAGTSASVWAANMQQLITAAKAGGGDVILRMGNPIGTSGTDYTVAENAYFAQALQLAIANNIPLLDVRTRWGGFAAAQTSQFMQPDWTHCLPAGYSDQAQGVRSVLALL